MKKWYKIPIFIKKRELIKLIITMKFALIFAVLTTVQIYGTVYSQGTRLSFTVKNASLEEIFESIEQQSEFKFLYHDALIDENMKFDLNIEDKTIEEVLDKIFMNSKNTYTVLENNLIVITPRENPKQQEITITGIVTDQEGVPLPGVNVVIKGTASGTVTDLNGNYAITVNSTNDILIFSSIGYLSKEIPVGEQRTIDLTLTESIESLEQVVVIGYGSVTKRELTGSVAQISEEDFNPGAVSNALELIQGKVAGLSITKMDGGDPTKGYEISLRGVTSINGDTEPLVVIDGIPGGDLNAISPDDIESISILKDGSAAAIYGTRGTNGVILITTKSGIKGKTSVEYSTRFYTERTLNRFEVLDREQYLAIKEEYAASGEASKIVIANSMIDYGEDTDWFKAIIRKPFSQNHHLALSGGTETGSYRISLDYNDQEVILLNSNAKDMRVIGNFMQSALKDKLKFNMQVGLSDNKNNGVDYNAVRQTIQRNPTEPIKNEDGSYFEILGAWQYENPVGTLEERINDDGGSHLFGNIGVDVYPIKSIKLNVVGGLNKYRGLGGYYLPSYSYPMENAGISGQAGRWASQDITQTLESTIEWKKTFGQHNVALLGGYTFQRYVTENFNASNSDFISDDVTYNNLGMGLYLSQGFATMDSYKGQSDLQGIFARGSYNYAGKYFLSASVRREGSSKFGKNYRYGTFPAVSAAWDISQEDFFTGISGIIDFLKLRIGYGVTGNQGLDEFYVPLIKYGQEEGIFYYNGEEIKGYGALSNSNPNLRWETKEEINFGFDWQLANQRLGGSIDYYVRNTYDLLEEYEVPVPPYLSNNMWANAMSLTSSGIEFTFDASPVKVGKFSWDFTLLFDHRKNTVNSLGDENFNYEWRNIGDIGPPGISAWTHRLEQNKAVGNIHTYKFEKIDENGQWVFADVNNDSVITIEDRTVVGNGIPDYYLGFTNTFRYGNIDLSVMLRGMFGHQIINAKRIWHENPKFLPRNVFTSALETDLWDDPEFSSYYVENGDFVKIDNITLGYTLPFKDFDYIKNIRIYGTINHAFVFTNYTGLDPEVSFSGENTLTPGNDNRFEYPSVRTFIVGLNVKF